MAQKSLFARPSGPKVKARPKPKRESINKDILAKINQRQRQILVHSNLYYRQDTNIVSDSTYDRWSHELFDLIKAHPAEFKKSAWYSAFITFDGNTGMGLPYTDPWVEATANHLLLIQKGK